MTYVQGFVVPVPHANREAYREVAEYLAPIFLDHGALRVVECWGDEVARGASTDFFRAVQAGEGENVVFSWVEYPDRATFDAAKAKVMADPRMQPRPDQPPPPFDPRRMIHGCFEPILDTDEA